MGRKALLTPDVEAIETGETIAASKALSRQGLRLSVLARDVATMGGATVLAAVFNTLLVFLIPRLVSVEDFGYWRLFLLYAGYAGFVHLGFADGALVSWAGRPLEEFRHEIRPSLKFLFWQHLAVVIPVSTFLAVVLHSSARFVGIAVLLFALITNSVTVLQYVLQGAKLFRPVAVATATPAGAFFALTFLLNLHKRPNFRELIILYCVAWAGLFVYLWIRAHPWRGAPSGAAFSLGKAYTLLGWPILLANGGFLLVQSADRLVVSSVLPIRDFAQYSLATGTMFVPVMAIVTIYRVFFSHVASVEEEKRATVYVQTSRFLLLLWSLSLPYYFVLEVFVRYFLPRYEPSLHVACILLLGVLLLADIQILHMSYFYLHGMQRQFLSQTIAALILSFSVALTMALRVRSVAAVAIGQVVALIFWWLANEWILRETSGQRWRDWLCVLCVAGWSATSYGLVLWLTRHVGWRILAYYVLIVFVLWFSCSSEFRLGWRLLRASVRGSAHSPLS